MNNRIDTKTAQNKLPIRKEPYWYKLSAGEFVGYRKTSLSEGSWVARKTKNRKHKYESLHRDQNTTFSDAQKLARQFFERSNGVHKIDYTVQNAIDDYIAHMKVENSIRAAKEAQQRLTKHMPKALAKTKLSQLATNKVKSFRDGMVKTIDNDDYESSEKIRKSKDSANRVMNMFKAALNLAYRNDFVSNDAPWRKVLSFKKVSRSRDIFFTDAQVNSLLLASNSDFRQLLELAINTGARYGELRELKAKDFDPKQMTLQLSGKTGTRTCFLSQQTTTLLKELSKLKLPDSQLLKRSDNSPWGEKDHYRPFIEAALKVNLPKGSVFYCLRHYHISKALLAGIPTQIIAENCGTSVKMIEKHYGKFMNADRLKLIDLVEITNLTNV